MTPKGEVVDGGGASTAVHIILPVAFTILFLLSVLMTSGFLLQGTATEKENKVVDVLLASANPDEVLSGKLLGLGAAGLLQVILWLSLLMVGGIGILPLLLSAHVEVPWTAALLALPLFIASFPFFGSLMMGSGSFGSNMRESQQLAMVWSLMAALPLMMTGPLIQDLDGVVARARWFPITSAAVVVLRASMDAAALAWWEAAGAFIVLVVSTWLAIRIGARLFRIGLLSSGARPSFKEIIGQVRLQGLLPQSQIDESCVCGHAGDRKVLVRLEKGCRLWPLALQFAPAGGDEVARPQPTQVVDHGRERYPSVRSSIP